MEQRYERWVLDENVVRAFDDWAEHSTSPLVGFFRIVVEHPAHGVLEHICEFVGGPTLRVTVHLDTRPYGMPTPGVLVKIKERMRMRHQCKNPSASNEFRDMLERY